MQALYGVFREESGAPGIGQEQLLTSIDRIYELYILLLYVLGQVFKAAKQDSDRIAQRHVTDKNNNHPHLEFMDNIVIKKLVDIRAINEFYFKNQESLSIEEELFSKIFKKLKNSNIYKEYKSNNNRKFDDDKAFVIKIFRKFICSSDELIHLFEEENIHWVDDIELAKISAVKTISDLTKSSDENHPLLQLYKDEKKDSKFAIDLYNQTIQKSSDIQKMLNKKTKNWDQDRVAVIDSLLMKMALTEVLHFKNIPVKVSINEYIEIAKKYSTPKSGAFINGILDNVVIGLKKANKIRKEGRGLIS